MLEVAVFSLSARSARLGHAPRAGKSTRAHTPRRQLPSLSPQTHRTSRRPAARAWAAPQSSPTGRRQSWHARRSWCLGLLRRRRRRRPRTGRRPWKVFGLEARTRVLGACVFPGARARENNQKPIAPLGRSEAKVRRGRRRRKNVAAPLHHRASGPDGLRLRLLRRVPGCPIALRRRGRPDRDRPGGVVGRGKKKRDARAAARFFPFLLRSPPTSTILSLPSIRLPSPAGWKPSPPTRSSGTPPN